MRSVIVNMFPIPAVEVQIIKKDNNTPQGTNSQYNCLLSNRSYRQGCSANKKGMETHPDNSCFETASKPF